MRELPLKTSVNRFWQSLTDGWAWLRQRAQGALTHYTPTASDRVPRDPQGRRLDVGQWGFLAIDLYEEGEELVVRVEAPGLHENELSWAVHDRLLTVSGVKRFEYRTQTQSYRMLECAYGSFQRTLTLPMEVSREAASTLWQDGVLQIRLKKQPTATVRQIPIRTR